MSIRFKFVIFNRLYLPISLVLGYLLVTVSLYEFGPINYYTPDKAIFYLYLSFYHTALFLGYLSAISFLRVRVAERSGRMISFWILVSFAVFGSLVENANVARLGTLVPTNIFQFAASGFNLSASGEAYYLTREASETYSANRILNIASIIFAWARVFLVIYIGLNIHRLTKLRIIVGASVVMIYPLGALSIGLNQPVLSTALLFMFAVGVNLFVNRSEISRRVFKIVKIWLYLGVAFVFLGLWNFTNNMYNRGVTIFFLEITSPAQYISVRCEFCSREEPDAFTGIIWLINYVVQGYHGFALALQQPFDSTFGFGNSSFLLRQFEIVSGENLAPLTFQEKTNHLWGAYSRWHSIYTHFANDVHFVGVGVVMFFIGGLFGFTWKLAVLQKNTYAVTLVPIYAFMFLFFPANNQVFGFVATLSAFIFGNFLMFVTFQKRN